MKKIGITGGIGSGKSVVVSFLKTVGIPVYFSDDEAKKLTDSSPVIKQQLTDFFGREIYSGSVLNRQVLASLIFENKNHLKFVNSVIHPEVMKHFNIWSEQYRNCPVIAMESAILFESGLENYLDVIWTVTAPVEVRLQRVLKREKTNRELVLQRMQNQFPDEEKMHLSDYVIVNDDFHAIIPQIEEILGQMLVFCR